MRLAIFTDFDGTITTRDCLVTLVNAFVSEERRAANNRRLFVDGDKLWEVLDTSLKDCALPLDEAIRYLHAHVGIDPTFGAFHAWCQAEGIPLEVVSAGVHEIVSSFLEREGLTLPIQANRAAHDGRRFGITPAHAACPTGVDKAAIVRQARETGHTAVFIGDGLSDRLAVPEADLVYAKSGLARYCAERGFAYVPFEQFDDVRRDLQARLAASALAAD